MAPLLEWTRPRVRPTAFYEREAVLEHLDGLEWAYAVATRTEAISQSRRRRSPGSRRRRASAAVRYTEGTPFSSLSMISIVRLHDPDTAGLWVAMTNCTPSF